MGELTKKGNDGRGGMAGQKKTEEKKLIGRGINCGGAKK